MAASQRLVFHNVVFHKSNRLHYLAAEVKSIVLCHPCLPRRNWLVDAVANLLRVALALVRALVDAVRVRVESVILVHNWPNASRILRFLVYDVLN